ncbi:MAG: ABC transporter ATP-binding protein, partial [Pseudomonadota bacterium]|nr:ABC transporter ATP-binding protein [Pseudomonadota bacterium]
MNIPAWRYYQQLYRDNYATLLFSVVLAILQGFILLPIAFLVRYTFDKVVPGNRIDLLLLTGGGIFLLYFLHSVSMLWTRTLVIKVTKLATQRFRYALLEKIYTLSRHYYTQADHSQIHTYLVQDTERIDVMANSVVGRLLPAVIISLTLCGVLLILNWFLFLTMLIVLPAVFFSSHYLSKMVKKRVRTFHACFRHFSRGMLFVLRMLDLTRIQTAEPYEYQRQQHHFNELRLASGAMIWSFNVFSLVQGTMATLAAVIILIIGGYAVMSATMTVGELLSFYVAVALLKNNLQGLASAIPQLIAGNESLTTLYHFLN